MNARSLVVMLFLAVAAGCGKPDGRTPVFPAKGSVVYQGKPAFGAVVVLHALTPQPGGTPRPRGKTAADGSFVLTTYVAGDGAPAGEYAVAVTWSAQTESAEQEGPSLIPTRYGDPKKSGLKVTIESRSNELRPFQLTR